MRRILDARDGSGRWPILVFMLLLIATSTAASADEPLRTRAGATPDLLHAIPKATMQEARSVNHVEGGEYAPEFAISENFDFAVAKRDPQSLLDGSFASTQRLGPGSAVALDFVFRGASEWVNQIELELRGSAVFTFDFLHHDGSWIPSEIEERPAAKSGESFTTEVYEVPVGRYQGFRIRLLEGATDVLEVAEVGAYWFEAEAMKDAYETADEWAEDYPGTSNDLSSPNLTCQRFSDYLRDRGWNWIFDWGDNDCWEEDYKRHDLGGNNNTWIDATDIFIHCSHGTDDQLFLARTDKDDTDVTAADINGAWGDGDVEWIFVHCCLNMKNLSWHNSLNGVHTVSGWRNVINSSSNWGKTIAQKLWDSGLFDSAWTIWQSWWHSNDTNQPSGNKGTLVAEDYGHFNEYIWGQGPVLADSPDGTHWYTDHTVSKMSKMGDRFYGTGPERSSEPLLWEPRPSLGKAGEPAMRVYVHPEVLQEAASKGQTPVGIFQVLPPNVSPGSVQTQLELMCELLGESCPTLASGVEDRDAVAAAAGPLSLSASTNSGALFFTNLERFMVPGQSPGQLISPDEAGVIAESFLSRMSLLSQEHMQLGIMTMVATEFQEPVGGQFEILQQFPFMHEVIFGKSMTAPGSVPLPVLGPGGRIHVSVGPQGEILAMNDVDRVLELVDVVPASHPQEVLDLVAAFGYRAVESAPEFPATQLTVRNMDLAYFERGAQSAQPTVGPVYVLDVDLTSNNAGKRVTEPGRLYVVADVPSLMGEILEPSDGTIVPVGSTVDFAGQAGGGTPPYSYEWSSSVQGFLSNAASFSTDQLMSSTKEGGTGAFTVELVVTDSNGYSSSAQISLTLSGVVSNEETPSSFMLAQNSPNPFNPRTVIEFTLASDADVTLAIFDLRGRRVRTILDAEPMHAGRQSRMWDSTDASGRPVAAGVYIYRLSAKSGGQLLFEQERKMTLIK